MSSGEGKATSAFAFRPSKLSSVGERIGQSWAAESKTSGTGATGTPAIASIFGGGLAGKKEAEAGKKEELIQAPKAYVFGSNIAGRVEAGGAGFTELAAKTPAEEETAQAASSTDALKESAAALEEKAPSGPLTESASVVTGEEGEENLFRASAKLHQFGKEEERWLERGQGQLRLNRRGSGGEARLVMRVSGSGRLVLNSLVFAEMLVERVTAKRLKISASEAGSSELALFLITAAEADSTRLESALKEAKDAAPKSAAADATDKSSGGEITVGKSASAESIEEDKAGEEAPDTSSVSEDGYAAGEDSAEEPLVKSASEERKRKTSTKAEEAEAPVKKPPNQS